MLLQARVWCKLPHIVAMPFFNYTALIPPGFEVPIRAW